MRQKFILEESKQWKCKKMMNSSRCTAKVSARYYKFRVPTFRREQPVRSEDLNWEIQGESGESQRAEPTDDAEARVDFLVHSR